MNVGILYPSSKAHPGITKDFVDGIKSFLKQRQPGSDISFFSESIGLGGAEKEVYEKAEKLLVIDDVDILVAYIDLRVISILEPLIYASGKLVIVVNPGASYPQNWIPKPNLVFLTLQDAFLCALAGKLAGDTKNASAVMATTFYDCGYLHTAAVVKGFAQDGRSISFNYVNNQAYNDQFNIKELAEFLDSDKKSNNLLCVFDELPASLFYDRLNELEVAEGLHLFVSPMMLQPKALQKLTAGFKFSIDGYLPWNILSEKESNTFFINSYHSQTKREPGIFSLLGWETGMLLEQVIVNCAAYLTDGTRIAETLSNTAIEGPRGALKLDLQTNYFISPVIKCSIKNNSNKVEMETIDLPEKEWKAFTEIITEGTVSGWTNTYLCY